jgi:hypothetical protein
VVEIPIDVAIGIFGELNASSPIAASLDSGTEMRDESLMKGFLVRLFELAEAGVVGEFRNSNGAAWGFDEVIG